MIPISHHTPPPSNVLQILQLLYPRMNLSATERRQYENLNKGYKGEQKLLDLLQKQLSTDYLLINDLLLKSNHTEFQIDTLLIGKDTIYPLEVKNYEGDFYIRDDNWYVASSGNEIRNPLLQLKRSEFLIRHLLQHARFRFSIKPSIVFINQAFTLYQAPLNLPVIFPTQIQHYIKRLNTNSFKQMEKHRRLAKYFIDHHLPQSSHEKLPIYEYEALKKGILCKSCSIFLPSFNYKKIICKRCGCEEDVESAVMRSILEFITLFPNRRITTNDIHEWCHIIESKKRIRRILIKNFIPVGKGRYTYYVFKD